MEDLPAKLERVELNPKSPWNQPLRPQSCKIVYWRWRITRVNRLESIESWETEQWMIEGRFWGRKEKGLPKYERIKWEERKKIKGLKSDHVFTSRRNLSVPRRETLDFDSFTLVRRIVTYLCHGTRTKTPTPTFTVRRSARCACRGAETGWKTPFYT